MKIIAIDVVWIFVISLASIIIALMIFSNLKERIFDFFYCKIYAKIFSINDEKCSAQQLIEKVYIFEKDEKRILMKFVALIISCWEDAERYQNFKTHYCYEVRFSNQTSFKIEPKTVAELLKEAYNCEKIQMKSYDCGYRDDIVWNADIIDENKIVMIKYLENHKIEIIA